MDISGGNEVRTTSTTTHKPVETLVMMVGDDGEIGLIVVETLLEKLIRKSPKLFILMAESKKNDRLGQCLSSDEYRALTERARALGGTIECAAATTGKSKYDVAEECASIAKRVPGATFCFYKWGLSEAKPDLKDRLATMGLNTIHLPELLKGAEAECES